MQRLCHNLLPEEQLVESSKMDDSELSKNCASFRARPDLDVVCQTLVWWSQKTDQCKVNTGNDDFKDRKFLTYRAHLGGFGQQVSHFLRPLAVNGLHKSNCRAPFVIMTNLVLLPCRRALAQQILHLLIIYLHHAGLPIKHREYSSYSSVLQDSSAVEDQCPFCSVFTDNLGKLEQGRFMPKDS